MIEVEPALAAVALLRAGVDALQGVGLDAVAEPVLVEVLAGVECELRRLASVDHGLMGQLEARGAGPSRGFRNTAALVAAVLRVDAAQAGRRVYAASQLAPRQAVSGQVLAARLPVVAAASASGEISPEQARVVMSTLDALPRALGPEVMGQIERDLTGEAATFAPRELRVLGRRMRDHHDPDGRLADDGDRARRRALVVRGHADGTVSGHFSTDATCGEALLTFLDASARRQPDESGQPDTRTGAQRRHDALRELLLARIRGGLPATAGVSTTIVLTMTPAQYTTAPNARDGAPGAAPNGPPSTSPNGAPNRPPDAAPNGAPDGAGRLVRTGHGALIDISEARRLFGDAQIHPVLLDWNWRILGHAASRRLYTQGERLCMIARDGGCTFPGCTTAATWCEAAHIQDFAKGGPTSTDNAMLLCGYHHRSYERLGWRPISLNGLPHWIPPPWIDPQQQPRRNRMHDPPRTPKPGL